jgi:hypothetical protein
MQREYVSVSVQPQGTYLGPCSAFLWSWSDEPIDVHVVSLATFLDRGLPMTIPPFVMPRGYESVTELWGFVTERTPNGPRPVPLAMVEHMYGDGLSGDATGYALTNAQGFYHLCGYWDDFGQSVRVSKPGYRTAVRPWLSEPGLDIELASE